MTISQHKLSWQNIFARRTEHIPTKHLVSMFHSQLAAKTHRPLNGSKKHNKGQGKHVGFILKGSYIKQQVHPEKWIGNSVKP